MKTKSRTTNRQANIPGEKTPNVLLNTDYAKCRLVPSLILINFNIRTENLEEEKKNILP
jgi:hypothetical protein